MGRERRPAARDEQSREQGGVGQCIEAQEGLENTGDSHTSPQTDSPAKVQQGERGRREGVRTSGKQNDKQNDKRAEPDTDLESIIDAWPSLPDAMKAVVLALVQTATQQKE